MKLHERARNLLLAVRVEGISAADQMWLEAHLAGCAECSKEAMSLDAVIHSLRALSVRVGSGTVQRTNLAVHRREEQRRLQQERAVPLWIAIATSSVWAIFTTPYAWATFARLGNLAHVPDTAWQLVFLMWWFLPATFLGAIAGWRHLDRRKANSNWATEVNGG